ncbi:MAG: NAD-dependent epimerase/dehydratase family protein, partial [Nevskiales bacterium]
QLVEMLAAGHPDIHVLATARRPLTLPQADHIHFAELDVCSEQAAALMKQQRINCVVHLASVVTPGPGMDRESMRRIDVDGTRNMLDAALQAGVEKFIVTTSAASYGYHADNPVPLDEADAVRGNYEFPYSHHKRLIEQLLADYRSQHPQLAQLVFRPGFVLGLGCDNQITNLFTKPAIVGVRGSESPFVIIWDEDVCRCIIQGITGTQTGIYNLAGDGTVSLREIAGLIGKPYIALPAAAIKAALFVAKNLRLSQYGPEQVNFLRYRPVLSNRRLKAQFGYQPEKSSMECFMTYARARGLLQDS